MRWLMLTLSLPLALIAACSGGGGSGGSGAPASTLGEAIPGLPAPQQAAFERGKALMDRRFTPAEGLGPLYNASHCSACHSTPVTGGSSPNYRNFYLAAQGPVIAQTPLFRSPGIPLGFQGDPRLPSIVVPTFAVIDGPRQAIPPSNPPIQTITLAQRNAPPMFGLGLFEFVSDQDILANSDPDDADGDGISGRVNRSGNPPAIGRFGYKSQSNNIEVFIRGAAQNQMGMTSDPVLGSNAVVTLIAGCRPALQAPALQTQRTQDADSVGDPEISAQDMADIVTFSRFLAPPQPRAFTAAATRGETLFAQIGCTKCHVAELPSTLGPVRAYTDLLLHDLGPALADGLALGVPDLSIIDPPHTGNEFRTQPLWGVSLTAPFLHDGRADTLHEAIVLHAGESLLIRQTYEALTQSEKDDIIAFLESL